LIERAYRTGEKMGLAVWTEDEAGPFQTVPVAGHSWEEDGQPRRHPQEYVRAGTAKLLTLFHPQSGHLRARGVQSCTNVVLHGWLKEELAAIVATLPAQPTRSRRATRRVWEHWQEGLAGRITLLQDLPPLRMLLVMDNLAGHKTPEMVLWMFRHGIMPLYTPLSGSWLNMGESVQRIIKRRALESQYPQTPDRIIDLLEATVRGWNCAPTPFEWGGRRAARRARSKAHRHALGGSGACVRRAIRSSPTVL
jgi:transposase